MLNVALPKGRLGEKVYKMLERAGYSCEELLKDTRKLVFTDEKSGVSYFWVKPSDVTVYVEHGVADIGVAGKDILEESGADVYELLDLKTGVCRMCVASVNGFREDYSRPLRVATKFPRVAERYFASRNRDIEVIKLYGSIELAPHTRPFRRNRRYRRNGHHAQRKQPRRARRNFPHKRAADCQQGALQVQARRNRRLRRKAEKGASR